jgi:hypothetical protein
MRLLFALPLLVGCGAVAVRVPPEDIGRLEYLPAGYEELGRVTASCSPLGGFQSTSGELLASFDCNRKRLERVLAEDASAAGADILVGTGCGHEGRALRCIAYAARAEGPAGLRPATDEGPAPGPAAVERWDEPRARASLLIRVDFEPSVTGFSRRKRRAAEVAEVTAAPVSHRELGTMTTRCDADECELRELRQALRIAAGGLGASDLVGVRCFGRGGERECVAELAVSQVDE